MPSLEKLRYPIGKFEWPKIIDPTDIHQCINRIETLPLRFRKAVETLTEEQLDVAYRPEGWTLRQVVHHVPDSHLNSYIRFKWTLTENKPVIKAYDEVAWAELPDYKTAPIATSLDFLELLHSKWVYLLRALTDENLEKTFIHPESGHEITLKSNLFLYEWHGDHHLGHIEQTKTLNGW
ncbi:putative metal-dependent hydrolase [Fulvivirga sp. M361]|uniref:YfiT family bacillithiol transferase n=1 Tax=Fulvivirga sp. M361 TaxID=2594266 RepID=UPI00117ACD04|nr:putative metal-dependent hydrolase [Fulvivirga sp. M361]TRX52181.1 putative metal-dependent hydrolase [Fulvivirga sp. M361]